MKTISLQMRETKAGAPYKVFQMEDGKRLSVFQFDTRYAEIIEGTDIPDDQLVYDQQYDNYKLKPLPKPAAPARAGGFGNVAAAQEKKREHIAEAQDNKERAITLAAAQRDAVLMVTTFEAATAFPTDDELKAKFRAWREFFLKEATERSDQPF